MDPESQEHYGWCVTHIPDCPKNFEGSAGGMETEGVIHLYDMHRLVVFFIVVYKIHPIKTLSSRWINIPK